MKFTFILHRCDVDNTTDCQQETERDRNLLEKNTNHYTYILQRNNMGDHNITM